MSDVCFARPNFTLFLFSVQVVELAWDASSRLLAAAAGNDVLVW
jgi:hypothetical protein